METDIHNLPLIPDEKMFYTFVVSFYECYEQLHDYKKFDDDIDLTMNQIFSIIQKWRKLYLVLDYPGDLNEN
jgi:hypothetical protein